MVGGAGSKPAPPTRPGRVACRPADDIEALRNVDLYETATRRSSNWRQLYLREFGLDVEDTEAAGELWEQAREDDETPAVFFDGLHEVLAELDPVPQGIVSQNSSTIIRRSLEAGGVDGRFDAIVGDDCVARDRLKPHPDSLLLCLRMLSLLDSGDAPGTVLFVGDHAVDATCAHRTNEWLADREAGLRIESVGAVYGGAYDHESWTTRPAHTAHTPADVLELARKISRH